MSSPPSTQFTHHSSYPQVNNIQSPSRSGLSHTSIALICAFIVCFFFFVYLSSRAPRLSDPVLAAASRPRRTRQRRCTGKPKLWDVWLDDDLRHGDLKPPETAVFNWRPLAAWTDDSAKPAVYRRSPLHPEVLSSHVAIAQALFRGPHALCPERSLAPADQSSPVPAPSALPPASDPRTLNVAVLVTMPSRRKFASRDSGATPHPTIGSGLSFDEGQLVMGVTGLSCEEETIRATLT